MARGNALLAIGATALVTGGGFLLLRGGSAEPQDEAPLGQVGTGNPLLDFFGASGFQGSTEPEQQPIAFTLEQQSVPEGFFTNPQPIVNPNDPVPFTQETADFLQEQGFADTDIRETTGFFPTFVGLQNLINTTSKKEPTSTPDTLPTLIGVDALASNITKDANVTSEERQGFFNFLTQSRNIDTNDLLSNAQAEATTSGTLNFQLANALRSNGQYAEANRLERSARNSFEFVENIQEKKDSNARRASGVSSGSLSKKTQDVLNTPASEVGIVSASVRNELQRARLASLTKQLARNENTKKSGESA